MKNKLLKTAVVVLLLVCLLMALPARAAASEDIIYVSDLYYGYHTAYMSVPLGNYSIATTEIMAQVYEDFIDSPAFLWTKVSGSLSAVTSPKDMFQIVSDAFIETEFTYNDALTAANEKLALGLLQATSNNDELTSTASAIVERVNGMGDLLSVIYQDCDLENLTDIEAIDKLFDYMVNNNSMKSLTSAQLEQVRGMILDDLQYIGNLTTAVTTIIDLMGGLYMSLVVEDARLTMLDTILPLVEEGTTLHDGLTLLDDQLRGGFATYFFDNYVVNEGLDLATTLGKNYLAGVYPPAALAVGLIDLANTVIFDVIFDVPSVDDFMLQTVLTHYSIELHTITRNKLDVFEQAFNSADVVEFERLYAAFSAAVTAGLEATERLTLDSNRDDFAAVNEQYGNYNYEAYINDIIADLYLIEPERRVLKEFTWKPTGSLRVENASNAPKEGYIYEFQGAVRGDVYVNNGLTIEADETCVLGGNLYVTGGALKVYGSLHVKGDLEISSGWNYSSYDALINYGTVQVDGDLDMTYSGYGSSYSSCFSNYGTVDVNGDLSINGSNSRTFFAMKDANAVLKVAGDVYAKEHALWSGIQGMVILDGTAQQELTNLSVYNLTVENPEGVKYLSNVKLYGTFDSQGAPIEYGNYRLQAVSPNAAFAGDGYDYGDVSIENTHSLSGHVRFQTLYIKGNVTVAQDGQCVVEENLYLTSNRLTVYGTLDVKGNMDVSASAYTTSYEAVINHGTVQVDGDLAMTLHVTNSSGYSSHFYNYSTVDVGGDLLLSGNYAGFAMQDADAVLKVAGDVSAYAFSSWRTAQGTIILDGTVQQNLTNLSVCNLTVENPEGVKYLSNVKLYGTFDSQDAPIEYGSYRLQAVSPNAAFAGDGYDYGDVSIENTHSLSGHVRFQTLYIKGNVTVAQDGQCVVEENLYLTSNRLTVYGILHVKGNMDVSASAYTSSYEAVINYGTVQVDEDLAMTLHVTNSSGYSSHFYNYSTVDVGGDLLLSGNYGGFAMQNADAVLRVAGDVSAYAFSSWRTNQGTVILDGTAQQELTNLSVYNLTVENPEGVKYLSNVKLYGTFDSQGAPIEYGNYRLQAVSSNAAFAGDGYDYGDVSIENTHSLSGHVRFQTLYIKGNVTVAQDGQCVVEKDLYLTSNRLTVYGILHVKGNMDVSASAYTSSYEAVINYGTVQVDEDLAMTLHVTNSSGYSSYFYNHGKTDIGGDLSLSGNYGFFSQKAADAELVIGGDCTGYSSHLSTTHGTARSLAAERTNALIAAMEPLTTVAAEQARTSYDALSAWQRTYVTGYSVLTAAEAKLAQGEKFTLMGSNMTLGNDLSLNFAAGISALAEPDGCTAVITKMNNGQIEETLTIPAVQWRTSKIYYLIGFPLAAAQMCDEVYVEIFDEDGYALSTNHCDDIRSYATRILEQEEQPETIKRVLVDMLNYGAAAQAYFGYNEDDPANALLTEEQQALASAKPQYINDQLPGSNFYGTNLSLVNNILLNFYFSGLKDQDLSSMYAQVKFTDTLGKAYDYIIAGDQWEAYGTSGDIYKIAVDKLVMSDANQLVTVLLYDENGELFGSCSDSMASYIVRSENSATASLYDAILRFSTSASTYMLSK